MTCLIITGFQRAGTTVLGEWIGSSSNVSYWGEIFHPDGLEDTPRADALRLRPAANFFRFRRDFLSRDEICRVPTLATRCEEWLSYLALLERLRPGATHVLNIKYSSWHNLDVAWRNPSEAPYLLSLAIEREYPILHCLRRDLLAQALSECVALASDVWHIPSARLDIPPPASVEIDPVFLMRRMRTCAAETQLYQLWFEAARSTEIWYEDLFEANGGFAARTGETIRSQIPDWRSDREPPLRKIGREPHVSIANVEALRAALMATEFAELASRHL